MGKTREKWMLRIGGLILLFAMIYLLLFPESASYATVNGLWLSARTVVPAVFPYLVLSGVFVSMGIADHVGVYLHRITERWFGLPGCCGAAVLLGILCGFPSGGKMAGMLYASGSISKDEAERLCAFSDFCGPPYIMTVLGTGILHSAKQGLIIFMVQTILSLAAGMVLGRGKRRHTLPKICGSIKSPAEAFTDAVKSATIGTLHICGYVTFFSVMMSALSPFFALLPIKVAALIYGFFEMSGGIARLAGSHDPLFCATVIVLWSGLSVLMQIHSSVGEDEISFLPYLAVRAVTVPIGAVMVYFLCRILG